MPEESLGQKIRRAREQRKWSQATLAEKLGVSTRTVLRWELKNELPHPVNQQALINLLGLKEEDFQRAGQQIEEVQEQETPALPDTRSELERMLPPEDDFKLYSGRRIYKGFSRTTYVTVNGRPLKYFGSPKYDPEKETVFEWGYYGAGPSNLAKAILADYLGETYPERGFGYAYRLNALLFGLLFKEDVIGELPRTIGKEIEDYWQITSTEIRKWFYSLEEEGITRAALLKERYGENSS